MFAVDARVSDVAGRLRVERRLTDATDEAPGVPVGVDRRQVVAFTYCPPRGPPVRQSPHQTNVLIPVSVLRPGARFTKYLTIILQLSYDNAEVTIDLRRTSNLQDISRRNASLFSGTSHLEKIVTSSQIVFVKSLARCKSLSYVDHTTNVR